MYNRPKVNKAWGFDFVDLTRPTLPVHQNSLLLCFFFIVLLQHQGIFLTFIGLNIVHIGHRQFKDIQTGNR